MPTSTSQFKTRVCGKEIAFDKMTINNYYNLPDLKEHKDDYNIYASNPDLDDVIRNLYRPDTTWTVARDSKKTFPSSAMSKNLKVWHHFIATRLIHVSHLTEVIKDWALLFLPFIQDRPWM